MDLIDFNPKKLKNMSLKELESLAKEIRAFLIDSISETGGHLGSNLGAIELTIALHYVFDSPQDSFIFDVGHQAYTHKILTGRFSKFSTLRTHNGLSGYISYSESEHDQWESGHAGEAISALHGILKAKSINQDHSHGIAVVGDGSITSGMSFEALNLLGADRNLKGIILLNDNNMSISKNVGALSNILTAMRGNKFIHASRRLLEKISPNILIRVYRRLKRMIKAFFQAGNIFEDMGYVYIGPIDGNHLKTLIKTLKQAEKMNKSVVIHAITKKGLGYDKAQEDEMGKFHGVTAFDKATGTSKKTLNGLVSFSEVISDAMIRYQSKESTFVIMPAMLVGTKFQKFQSMFPNHLLDVGIAEEHAATMASAMARNGIKVFLPLYATFAQRAYDQILNDIARTDTHVVFGIDRAGMVGDDGSTHQGLFDVGMFYTMPNVIITMPRNATEANDLIHYGFGQNHPFVIRYPRYETEKLSDSYHYNGTTLTWRSLSEGNNTWISYGPLLDTLLEIKDELNSDTEIINAISLKPLDTETLKRLYQKSGKILIVEEAYDSPLGLHILKDMQQNNVLAKVTTLGVDEIIHHGSRNDNLADALLDKASLIKAIRNL